MKTENFISSLSEDLASETVCRITFYDIPGVELHIKDVEENSILSQPN